MTNDELKTFIEVTFQNVVKEMSRVAGLVEGQADWIRRIELNSTTRIAELQKDVNAAFQEIRTLESNMKGEVAALKSVINSVSQSLNAEEDARTLAGSSLKDQISNVDNKHDIKWEHQERENDKNKTLRTGIWIVACAVVVDIAMRVMNFIMSGAFTP